MLNFNTTLFNAINGRALHYLPLDVFFITATSYYFSYLVFGSIALYICVYLPYNAATPMLRLQRYMQALFAVLSVFVTWYVVKVVKVLVALPRPYTTLTQAQLLVPNTAALESFPSGHTALLMALATSVYFYHKKLGALLFLLTVIVGISRIFVGVHYPFDVFGGMVIGVLVPYVIHRGFAERGKKG